MTPPSGQKHHGHHDTLGFRAVKETADGLSGRSSKRLPLPLPLPLPSPRQHHPHFFGCCSGGWIPGLIATRVVTRWSMSRRYGPGGTPSERDARDGRSWTDRHNYSYVLSMAKSKLGPRNSNTQDFFLYFFSFFFFFFFG